MEWNRHQIAVTNYGDLLLRTREELFIDGQVADTTRGWGNGSTRELVGKVDSDDGTHEVRAHVGGIRGGFVVGCQLFIDNELVGGDIDKEFRRSNVKTTRSIFPLVIAFCAFGVFFLVRAFFVPPPVQVQTRYRAVHRAGRHVHWPDCVLRQEGATFNRQRAAAWLCPRGVHRVQR